MAIATVLMAYDMPHGWLKGGSAPLQYEMGTDVGAGQHGKNAATIRSIRQDVNGYGNMVQSIASDRYKGKRLRFTGYLKTKNVDQWAGLLMKVITKKKEPTTGHEYGTIIAYDNMYNRFVNGTQDFTKYEIVLDVPDSATDIVFGARLTGAGQIWFDKLKFDVVDNNVPVTSSGLEEPTNLDFEK